MCHIAVVLLWLKERTPMKLWKCRSSPLKNARTKKNHISAFTEGKPAVVHETTCNPPGPTVSPWNLTFCSRRKSGNFSLEPPRLGTGCADYLSCFFSCLVFWNKIQPYVWFAKNDQTNPDQVSFMTTQLCVFKETQKDTKKVFVWMDTSWFLYLFNGTKNW